VVGVLSISNHVFTAPGSESDTVLRHGLKEIPTTKEDISLTRIQKGLAPLVQSAAGVTLVILHHNVTGTGLKNLAFM